MTVASMFFEHLEVLKTRKGSEKLVKIFSKRKSQSVKGEEAVELNDLLIIINLIR